MLLRSASSGCALVVALMVAGFPTVGNAGDDHVVPKGQEAFFLSALAVGAPWTLDKVNIENSTVSATWKGAGGAFSLNIKHPDSEGDVLVKTAKFAISGSNVPADLVKAVAAKLSAEEGAYAWGTAADVRESDWTPTVPPAALPVSRMPMSEFSSTGARSVDDVSVLKKAAGFLLAGDLAGANGALVGLKSPCALADAMLFALHETKDPAAILKFLPTAAPADPKCLHLARMKAAYSAKDAPELVHYAKIAVKGLGHDADVLYLWGDYFYQRMEFVACLEPWGILARDDPYYPGVLGLYGTAAVQSGHLSMERSLEYLNAANEDHKDIVSGFLAGIGLHYQRKVEPTIPALERAMAAVPEEPRIAMYLAMAYFFTDQQEKSEKTLESIEKYAFHEPDVYYSQSLVYRNHDLPKAISAMEKFLKVIENPDRIIFLLAKVDKARKDLELMRQGIVPSVFIQGGPNATGEPVGDGAVGGDGAQGGENHEGGANLEPVPAK